MPLLNQYNAEEVEPNFLESSYGLAAGTLVSAVSTVADSVASVGNKLGVNAAYEPSDTREVIRSYAGETAAKFYDRNPNLVEGTGLVVGSLVPGAVGIRALRAAQAVKGSNLSAILNLPHSTLQGARDAAKAAAATGEAVYGSVTGNSLKAVASGFGANVLDAAAFEVAAIAATFASPVYSEFTDGDYASTIATNIALGGAIGGVFSAAKTAYSIKKAGAEASASTSGIRVLSDLGAATAAPETNLRALISHKAKLQADSEVALSNGANPSLVAGTLETAKASIETQMHLELTRLNPTDLEVVDKLQKLLNSTPEGKPLNAGDIIGLAASVNRGAAFEGTTAMTFDTHTGTSFIAGASLPKHFGDTLAPKTLVHTNADSLLLIPEKGTVKTINTSGNFAEADDIVVQASWLRAAKDPSINLRVAAHDLPAMEKLLQLDDNALVKQVVTIGGKRYSSVDELKIALFEEKVAQYEKLIATHTPEQIALRLNVTKEFASGAEFTNMIARKGDELSSYLLSPRHISITYAIPDDVSVASKLFMGDHVTSIDINTLLRLRNEVVSSKVTARIVAKLETGSVMEAPTLVVKADGTLTFDGNKRITAVRKYLEGVEGENTSVPVKVVVQDGAVIPTHLPDGTPFPVVKDAAGNLVPNPALYSVPVRLTRAFAEESLRVDNMNKLFSEERNSIAIGLIPGLANTPTEQLILERIRVASSSSETGQSFIGSTEGATGGLSGAMQHLGVMVNNLLRNSRELTEDALNPHIVKAMKDDTFNTGRQLITMANYLASQQDKYVLAAGGIKRLDVAINEGLLAARSNVLAARDAAAKAGELTAAKSKQFAAELKAASRQHYPTDAAAKEFIPLTEEALALLATSTKLNLTARAKSTMAAATTGHNSMTLAEQYGLEQVYTPTVNTARFPFFVFVRQADNITQKSHTSVMTAVSPAALAAKVKILQRDFPGMEFVGSPKSNYDFKYKKDVEDFHKAKGDYEYARGMNDSAIDHAIASKKELHEAFPPIDKQHATEFFNDLTDWHRKMSDKSVRDTVELKYAQAFRQLEVMGDSFTKTGTSKFGGNSTSAASFAASAVANPFADMIKQALDISKQAEYPMFLAANEFLNKGFAKLSLQVRKTGLAMLETTNPRDFEAEVVALNKTVQDMGIGNAYEKGMLYKFRDMLPTNPTLGTNIAKANAGLNFLVLGSDVLQAFNTLIGTTVHATELVALHKAILKKEGAGAGKLGQLAGHADSMPSLVESVSEAVISYFKGGQVWDAATNSFIHESGEDMMARFIRYGLRVGDAKALRDAMDNLAYDSSTGVSGWGAKINAGMEVVRTMTGNNAADAISKFMAARSMDIYVQKALSKGILSSQEEGAIYITQHVTRVHGASIASQRPIMFSGAIGQSIGVFMTFYVNFLQRMFQHAGAGESAALTTMAGMQVALYGLQGLPAFNAINTHIIGTANGNPKHRDIYTAVGGSEEAKWMLYGAGSNMLGLIHPDLAVNLYSRGDLNPRQASIIPIVPADTALWSATVKTVSNLASLATHISGGAGVLPSLAFAMEHNGVNRPISGLGAIMGGGQTTGKGSLMAGYNNPDYSIFAWGARLAGGKPLDDALASDALYRQTAYKADRTDRIAKVGENMRIAMRNGSSPDTSEFLRSYVKAGGDTDNFNSFMKRQFMNANNSQINKAADDLNSPEAEGLFRLMGGEYVADIAHP